MLRELLSIFRPGNPLREMADNFATMLDKAHQQALKAGVIYFHESALPEDRTEIYRQDTEVNKLERLIRKQVIAHLGLRGNTPDVPYCLLLMSLVKDVERIGDYAKNLSEVIEVHPDPLPDDEILAELREIRSGVETAFESTSHVFAESDRERAIELVRGLRDIMHRCDALLSRIAHSDYPAGPTTAAVLGARYYKRFGGHSVNVLSSVVMPLHKLDYYDDDVEPPRRDTD